MDHHPIADLFPMLAEDELRELAADIKQRGQLQPIMLDEEGRILDGRNRNAACNLAGVEPWFETYSGDDPDGYALSVNVNRREMTKGQKAMVIVLADDLYNLYSQSKLASDTGIPQPRFSEANTILRFARELATDVIAGETPLSEAFKVAKARKAEAESTGSQLEELRKLAPDLAVFVENGIRNLSDALKEAKLRAIVREIDEARNADGAPAPTFAERADSGSITWDEAATLAQQWRTERGESIQRDQGRIRQVISGWGSVRTVVDRAETPFVADIVGGLGDTDRTELDRIITELKG
jgi:ParB-like nuclease family protein